MVGEAGPVSRPGRSLTGRILRWSLSALLVIAIVVVLWNQGQRLIAGESDGWASYLLIVLLVFGDAICPVLPGETTLNAGAVLAANGHLSIWLVILSGAIGAVAGDSTVYWVARCARGRVRDWMDRAAGAKTGVKVVQTLRTSGPVFLLFGRYIPGVRFALNVALGGVVKMPYRRFIFWSAISGTLWSVITCSAAYYVGTALAGYPVISMVITGVGTTLLIGLIVWAQQRWSQRDAPAGG
ncbi:DedA family protein [Jatrophihabitans sp. GAS493]|uniref:DedA family protein n=1 Tax=Jatrophihabitans sp. GAS493 TaxID=1907575 RepID=UPI0012FDAFE9|nr:DedA family protein [Jatrophihabitans sp. GAS493]